MVTKITSNPENVSDVVEKNSGVSLEDLARQADQNEASGEAESAKVEAQSVRQETHSLAGEIEDALDMAAPFAEAGMWWLKPEQFKALWGKETRKKIAAAAAAVMLKHGWSLGAVLEKYAPYIALGMAIAPSTVATVQLYKQAKAEQKPVQAKQEDGSDATTS